MIEICSKIKTNIDRVFDANITDYHLPKTQSVFVLSVNTTDI